MPFSGRNSVQKSRLDVRPSLQAAIPEPVQAPDSFHFWNGDEYNGQFTLYKDKQKMVMGGKGVYTTADGQTYEGLWEDDCLKDDCKITFPDKSVFSGELDDMTIQGHGKYTFKENIQIEGEFINNVPVGKIHLKDPNKRLWRGEINSEDSVLTFYPLHTFWQSVLHLPSRDADLFYGEAVEEREIWDGMY